MLAFASTQVASVHTSDPTAFLVLLALFVGGLAVWGLNVVVRRRRAQRAAALVEGDFGAFMLEALASAASIDGRLGREECAAIAAAMRETAGAELSGAQVKAVAAAARLSKGDLIAYLGEKSQLFSHEQKTALLKALLGVFVADGRFDDVEHAALIDYTAAVGFDRQSAPQRLRGVLDDMARDKIA